jgi:hypothetical protein
MSQQHLLGGIVMFDATSGGGGGMFGAQRKIVPALLFTPSMLVPAGTGTITPTLGGSVCGGITPGGVVTIEIVIVHGVPLPIDRFGPHGCAYALAPNARSINAVNAPAIVAMRSVRKRVLIGTSIRKGW